MRVFVTGANGYLGSHLVPRLHAAGFCVFCVDSHMRCLPSFPRQSFTYDPLSVIGNHDVIIHAGWYSEVGSANTDLQIASLKATKTLLGECKPWQRFIFLSSAAVYGDRGDQPCDERLSPLPNCSYGKAKLAAEQLIRGGFNECPVPNHLILRCGSMMGLGYVDPVTGKRSRTKVQLCVNAFASQAHRDGTVKVWDPECWKPVIHVQDVADWLVHACNDGDWRGTFNVGMSNTARNLAQIACKHVGAGLEVIPSPSPGVSKSCVMNSAKFLWKAVQTHPNHAFRSVEDAVREFKDFQELPTDRNMPWSS